MRALTISSRRGIHAALLIALLLAALLLRLPGWNEPWFGHHTAWGGAMYGNISRNYVIYGYLATEFGPVANFGPADQSEFYYYYHYPPLLVWLVSVSFHLFGVSEWSARLVPLLFSLLAVPLTFDLGRRLSGDLRVATLAGALSVAMPMGVLYGTHIDVYGPPAVTLTLLMFGGYAYWLQSPSTSALAVLFTGLVLGCMMAWLTYFAVLLVLVHNWGFAPQRRFPWRVALALILLPPIVFGAFLAHRWSLAVGASNEVYGTLWQKLLVRMSYADLPKPLLAVLAGHARDTLRLYTPLAVALSGYWLLSMVLRAAVQRSLPDSATWLLLSLLGYGVLHNLVFPSLLVNHDFMAGAYGAGLAITAAMATVAITDMVAPKHRRNGALTLAVVALAVIGSATISSWRKVMRTDSRDAVARTELGEAIRGSSAENELVVVPIAEDRVLQFYTRREMYFGVSEPIMLANLPIVRHHRVFVAAADWLERLPDLREHLEQHSERRATVPLVVFDLSAPLAAPPNNAASPRPTHD